MAPTTKEQQKTEYKTVAMCQKTKICNTNSLDQARSSHSRHMIVWHALNNFDGII